MPGRKSNFYATGDPGGQDLTRLVFMLILLLVLRSLCSTQWTRSDTELTCVAGVPFRAREKSGDERVVSKSYQREGQPRKTENELTNDT